MENDTNKIIAEQLKRLPPELKQALASIDMTSHLQALRNKYSLLIDKLGILETEIWLVMLGLESPDEFTNNLMRHVGLSANDATLISKDINERIFLSIRTALRQIQEKEALEDESTFTLNHKDVLKGIEEPGAITEDKQTLLSESKPATARAPVNLPTGTNPPQTTDWPKSETAPEKLAERIERPKVESMGVNILEDKMSKVVHIQKETKVIEPEQSKLPPVAPKPTAPPSMLKKQYGVDPYREPTS